VFLSKPARPAAATDAARAKGAAGGGGEDALQRQTVWPVAKLAEIHGRRYVLRASALELLFSDGESAFLSFPPQRGHSGSAVAKRVYKRLVAAAGPQLRYHYLDDPDRALRRYKITEDWVNRRISNFEYLMLLNRCCETHLPGVNQV
jgi:hypothetical protein